MSQIMNEIKRQFYTMASKEDDTAEIVMYGEIVEQRPTNFFTGEHEEGNFIILNEFLDDFKTIENAKNLTIRMNSYGGDAAVSLMIHNKLRELANNGTSLVCIVDGVAMSGGSLIMCACDNVKVNPSSLIMIHNCLTFACGSYNAEELRKLASSCDAFDKSQVEVYRRKTGLSEKEIKDMMNDTTYITGKEAIEKGFADELLEDSTPVKIAANANKTKMYVNGNEFNIGNRFPLPENIPTVEAEGIHSVKIDNIPEEGGNKMQEVKEAVGTLSQKDIEKAVKSERARIKEIDEISALFDDNLVAEAKYGESACTAKDLAYRAAQEAAKNGKAFLNNMADDTANSGTISVSALPTDVENQNTEKTPEQRRHEASEIVKNLLGGGKNNG